MNTLQDNKTKKHIRFITASSLFDGHDASINIMRRILQSSGAEVIHLGHNRSVEEIVNAAIQEDVQGIAVSSYQGGHVEYFKYMYDLLKERNASHIRIYGGGGGVIIPREIQELHDYGIARIFSPEDGRKYGLQGMIDIQIKECEEQVITYDTASLLKNLSSGDFLTVARLITAVENEVEKKQEEQKEEKKPFDPNSVTVDFDTLEKGLVTVRHRDSMKQDVVAVEDLKAYFTGKFDF